MREGVIDGVLPQIYTADPASFSAALVQHADAYGGDRLLGVTLDAFRPGVDLASQIETARAYGFAGSSPFRHGTLGEFGYFEHLRRAWTNTAEWPEMPWKNSRVKRLSLKGACGADRMERRWTVHNPNAWAIPVEWRVVGTGQTGSYFAPPGESSFTATGHSFLPAVAILSWESERRTPRIAAAVSFACR